jgi:ligand-binding sensor domain-containing protein
MMMFLFVNGRFAPFYWMKSTFMNVIYTLLSVLVVKLCLIGSVFAAEPYVPQIADPFSEGWRFRQFPELDGLGLRCMTEDSTGTMWFGLNEGVRSYDGVVWTPYTPQEGLPNAPVNVLLTAKDGRVYAGSDMGIGRFDGENWTHIFPQDEELPWPIDDLMQASDGSVWAATPWGALRILDTEYVLFARQSHGEILKNIAPEITLKAVPESVVPNYPWDALMTAPSAPPLLAGIGVALADGGWLSTSRGDVPAVIIDVAPNSPGEAAGLRPGDKIVGIDGRKEVKRQWFFGQAGSSVSVAFVAYGSQDTQTVIVHREMVPEQVSRFDVYDLLEDHDGNFWMGLWDGRLVRFSPKTEQWRVFDESDGFVLRYGPRLEQMQDGTLWLAKNGGGDIYQYDGQVWSAHTINGNSVITSLIQTRDGVVWAGGFNIFAFNKGVQKVYSPNRLAVPLPSQRLRLLETQKGNLWMAGLGQDAVLMDYGDERWQTFVDVQFQCQSKDGTNWFTANDKLIT